MNEYRFNLTGENRKALVAAVAEILNTPQCYKGGRNAAYEVGDYTITKDGTLIGPCYVVTFYTSKFLEITIFFSNA